MSYSKQKMNLLPNSQNAVSASNPKNKVTNWSSLANAQVPSTSCIKTA